ncbi:hypothetical protein GLW08_17755 [Pontibacillus yanchengensis]|uniref:Uncharacterized protein n=2 Tax=Pontibacillus yanchengensis TaxID=462910 RepID=A0ACC7VLU8_9BACI|nr:YxlC family protein [Pontibacillus yanchengensis]MYL32790.1 hypothetical protein [Pontibacillus yanchengensis]MYL55184.1 hypothetical protein [Pontibacillus yanchengensis]
MSDDKSFKEEKIIQVVKVTSENIDDEVNVNEPSLDFFKNLVHQERQAWYRRLWIELLIFWCIALSIISLMTISILYIPIIFVGIQLIVAIGLSGYFIKEYARMAVVQNDLH